MPIFCGLSSLIGRDPGDVLLAEQWTMATGVFVRHGNLHGRRLFMMICRLTILAVIFAAAARPASAVIVAGDYATTSDSGVNTTPPADDPGWYNIGSVGSASAIYLGSDLSGDCWVLSANHVTLGATSFTFFDKSLSQYVTGTYQIVPNSGVVLTNPSGPGAGQNSDLVMYRVDPNSSPYGAPNLPQPILAPSQPTSGTVIGIGRGIDRQSTETYWDNSQPVWQTVATPQQASHTGYIISGSQTMRWGDNQIDQSNVSFNVGTTAHPIYVQSFTTKFDQFEPSGGGTALSSEFNATIGDSGGGVFQKLGNTWVLSGMIDGITLLPGQPYPSSTTPNAPVTAAFGDSTIISDLSVYKSQILALNPLTGDANGDGVVNGLDISLISSNWLTAGPSGDVNHDGVVNGLDIAMASANWTGSPGSGGGAGSGGGGTSVPEPATIVLAIAPFVMLLLRSTRTIRR